METNDSYNYRPIIPRWIAIVLGILLILLILILVAEQGNNLRNTFANGKPANTISVTGQGKVMATPDLATIDIGVVSQASTAAAAQSQNNTKINQVITYVKSQGVSDSDITTSQFNLSPQENYTGSTPSITGYEIDQTVTVKVHNVDKSQTVLNNVLDGVVKNGANEIQDVNLSVENPDDLQNQARTQAIQDAKTQAQQLASAAGLKLGKVVSVSETSSPVITPLPYAANQAMAVGSSGSSAANIQTGSQEIDEQMTVTFEVK